MQQCVRRILLPTLEDKTIIFKEASKTTCDHLVPDLQKK